MSKLHELGYKCAALSSAVFQTSYFACAVTVQSSIMCRGFHEMLCRCVEILKLTSMERLIGINSKKHANNF